MRRSVLIFLAWTTFCASPARAQEFETKDDFDTKHIFGFTEGTAINAPDEREAEFVTTAHFLKRGGGLYRAAEQEATAEGALTQGLGYELTLHGAAVQTRGAAGLDPLRQVNFSGLSVEPKFIVLSRDSAPIGLAVSLQPEWERIDAVSGRGARSFALPARLMADAAWGGRFYAGANLLYAPEWDREAGAPAARGALFGATGALAWRLAPQISLGGAVEAYAATRSLGLGAPAGTAVYLGPTFFARLAPNLFIAGAWSIQVGGRPVAGGLEDYNQTEFSRHKARLTLGFAL
ncbi:hypothetical protein CCR94_20025 [Rhodoblastus sphagnicola]|uniref:Uncharacterized protein n=1 Tax=Rhodoblastus sphagnicola TaxID=333368 RepID=A0A2S6MYU2_9HYPH|nr:hypothetical protein [Rhodoblastus sphagnicola]MBB4196445.1 hypothetical protein [Rhodoblastus sphagnicola]PPQ27516.1 hypothetical protein CCR94_20025 [Rhodoblastus sphagnicola]